jgi:hypothetical protein
MYTIDSYGQYAASALTFIALVRYLAAGGMTVAGRNRHCYRANDP